MIYRFRIISDENDRFQRVIEIDEEDSFLNFHHAIQASVDYDGTQMASFFVSDRDWVRGEQITLMDMGRDEDDDSEEEILLMEDTKINEFITSEENTLIYVFDFMADRAFYITLTEVKDKDDDVLYPVCTVSTEDAPEQTMYDGDDVKDFLGEEYFDEDDDSDFYKKGKKESFDFDDLGNFDDLEDDDDLYGGGGFGGGYGGGYGGGSYDDDPYY